ncbi:MAG: tetratricopeptide repeat protein, partial [Myxococcota bacterium]
HELVSATQEAARQAEELDQITQLEVLKALGWLMLELDYFDEARDAYRRAHDVAMQIGDRRAAGHISGNLGIIAGATGDLDEAVRLYDEAVLRYRQAGNQRMASTYLGFRGRALAGAGRLDEARQALTDSLVPEEPRKTRFTEGFRVALALVDARRGHLDIAGLPEEPAHGGWAVPIVHEGFAALRAGDRLQAATALDGLRARIDAVEFGGRELLTAFADALDVAVSAWGFSPHGEWFEPPRQPRVSLEHRPTLGRVLAHLVVQRRDAPGTPSDVAALFAAGWPGEQATPSSAANRVRVALSNLRKAGLGPVLDREEAGWLLSVEAPVSWDRPA